MANLNVKESESSTSSAESPIFFGLLQKLLQDADLGLMHNRVAHAMLKNTQTNKYIGLADTLTTQLSSKSSVSPELSLEKNLWKFLTEAHGRGTTKLLNSCEIQLILFTKKTQTIDLTYETTDKQNLSATKKIQVRVGIFSGIKLNNTKMIQQPPSVTSKPSTSCHQGSWGAAIFSSEKVLMDNSLTIALMTKDASDRNCSQELHKYTPYRITGNTTSKSIRLLESRTFCTDRFFCSPQQEKLPAPWCFHQCEP